MADIQYNRYKNIIIFAKDWRKYKLSYKQLDETAFRGEMQTESYVAFECADLKKNRQVFIYLFDKDSKYTNSSQDLRKLLKKIKNPCDVILITYKPFNTYGKKAIASFKHLNAMNYRHEIFDLVLPNGPLCYPHRIMTREEVLHLCNEELFCHIINLPKIFNEDPQCIWIGAESGDVIEIKMLSDISGEVVHYRVVVPKNGRVIFSKEIPDADEKTATGDAVADPDVDVDDELAEHRELNVLENSDEDEPEDQPEDHPEESEAE